MSLVFELFKINNKRSSRIDHSGRQKNDNQSEFNDTLNEFASKCVATCFLEKFVHLEIHVSCHFVYFRSNKVSFFVDLA